MQDASAREENLGGQLVSFLDETVAWSRKYPRPTTKQQARSAHQQFWRWYKAWLKDVHVHQKKANEAYQRDQKKAHRIEPSKRQRRLGKVGVHKLAAPVVRQQLFEWFIGLRYSIDWTKYNKDCRSRGDLKSIGRFP